MYLWESDIQESIVFKPIEIRGKKGRKKMKKSNTAIYIPNMNADNFQKICDEKGLQFVYVPVPPHYDLIDHNALKIAVMNGDCETRVDFLKHTLDCINKAPVVIPSDMPTYEA